MHQILAWLMALVCLLAGSPAMGVQTQAGDGVRPGDVFDARVSYVVDGDSIWVRPDTGGRVRLRLAGIDAPEICQTSGPEAREAMRALALDQTVRVTILARDRYGRAIARVRRRVDDVDIGQRMVTEGWAWNESFRWHGGDYGAEQQAAMTARRGLFAHADAHPEWPADFRRRHGPCASYR